MPERHRIRTAGPADAGVLAELAWTTYVETFIEGFAIPYPTADVEAFRVANYTVEANRPRLNDPAQRVWLAEDASGRALAYAAAGG